MVATLQSFLAWAMSEDEDRQGILWFALVIVSMKQMVQ